MDNKTNRWITSAFLITGFGVIALAGNRAAVQEPLASQNVLVTNAVGQEVPVKQSATWNVAGNVHAFITNAAASPVPITNRDEEGRNEFHLGFTGIIPIGYAATDVDFSINPPAGKRLIITHYSVFASAASPSPTANYAELITKDKNGTSKGGFYSPITALAGSAIYSIGESDVFIPIDTSDTATALQVARVQDNANLTKPVQIYGALQGYYVSVP